MPPKKAPIYCLVNGDPENSVFGIKYDKNTTVDELKEIIYTKKKNAFADIDYPDLTLYKVNINLNTDNPQRTALTTPNATIVGDFGGQVLRPMDNIEEKFPTPANGHIHVIVDVPAVPATIGVTERYWTKILEFTGLDYQSTTREIEFPTLDLNLEYERIGAFGWTDAIERSQNDRYTPHLKNILKLDTFRTLGLYDPTGDDSFLSTNTDILPIRLTGTTDLVIVDRHSIASQAQEKHIRFLFELKKVVKRIHTFQAMAELISADLKSKYPVLAVLTDLMDDWRFFWIQGKIIMRLTLSREESVALIRRNLVSANNEMRELANQGSSEMDMESSFFEEEPLPRRQKLRHVVATSNVSSDIAPMEDFFDTMSEEEIFRYKAKQILTQFFSQPIFNELNDQKKIPLQSDDEKNILD
ncbi:crinkler (CRN) family protein [Rhizophagus clarus]|uniref:Crinkler (CRN) family protein n=1 Tax=Rhizophagus clarus TaxID=94130 RepID=A0A8H3QW99_9GLOM|nr:crinkler (CRN) family protein [Rhizophagus clarus]